MKRFISCAFTAVAGLMIMASCNKNDDDNNIVPPRDYAVQKAVEEKDIEDYLDDNYIEVDADMNVKFGKLDSEHTVSIRNQTTYRLTSKDVVFSGQTYKVYYVILQEGVGDAPTRGDDVIVAFDGTLLNGNRFDYVPFPQNKSSLSETILGWQEIIPEFKEGTYNNSSNPQDPPVYENYGAGIMFIPSALGYYNMPTPTIPAYSTLIFSFKLYRVEDSDVDGDGLTNKQELGDTDDPADFDSDGDGIPNYLDTDDDGDGTLTRVEITNQATNQLYGFDAIPACPGGNGQKRHLDPTCDGL